MEPGAQTVIVGIVGIMATLLSSGLGLYFTARARATPMRQRLYEKQLDIAVEIMQLTGRFRVYCPIILDPETAQFKEQAVDDLREALRELSELSDSSAAILPTVVWIEVRQLCRVVTDFLVHYDQGESVSSFPEVLAGQATKTALVIRAFLGVDELSEESALLFTKRKRLRRTTDIEPEEIIKLSKGR